MKFETIGKNIRKYRKMRNLRQGDLAEMFFATPKCRKLQNRNVGNCNCIFQNIAVGRASRLGRLETTQAL